MSSPSTSQPSKPQRVLACVLCQQRKIKCDRKFPCANCIKSRAQCVPASQLPRRRRRRFPERQLLDQLRKYEHLLRQNNIKFDPLHKDLLGAEESPNIEGDYGSDGSSPSTTVKPERVPEVKNFWHAMRKSFQDPDDDSDCSPEDVGEVAVKKAWDQSFLNDDPLIFGPRYTSVDLSTLHPDPVHIFRLWQLYLDNVNPLLRVTHTPTFQGRIIETVSDMKNVSPILEALMFSIYSIAVLSLTVDECPAMFGSSKNDLLSKYQFGCQQALLKCGFLRCSDRDCLTALYLYLVSVSASTDPRALSSMLGLAIRIAQRMRIDRESACAECGVLEGEMRRRLWWALVLFDTRVGQLADYKAQTLTPTWDCRTPLNLNDADLRPEMKEPPAVHWQPTEAIFAVVRSEVGDFIRNTTCHLDYTAPDLKPIARTSQHGSISEDGELLYLEKMVEDKYFKFCDLHNPLHFMTIWKTRGYLAKCRLMESYSRFPSSCLSQTEEQPQLDAAAPHALRMLECDTKIMTSPLTKPYRWLAHYHFPFPAYIQLLKDLRRRPLIEHANRAWEVMSCNCEARFASAFPDNGPFFKLFTRLVFHAWEAREMASTQSGETVVPPRIVSNLDMQWSERRKIHTPLAQSRQIRVRMWERTTFSCRCR